MNRLKDKVAIVTGSTSGIGIGIAQLYAAEGAVVIVCGRRAEKGQAVVDSILAEGGKAAFHTLDITDTDSIEKLVADTAAEYGRIDILVNNAANVALKDGRVDELTVEMWDAISTVICAELFILPNACCRICVRRSAVVLSSTLAQWLPAAAIWAPPPMPAPRPAWICSLARWRCNMVRKMSVVTVCVPA